MHIKTNILLLLLLAPFLSTVPISDTPMEVFMGTNPSHGVFKQRKLSGGVEMFLRDVVKAEN